MDQIIQDDVFRHKESASALGNSSHKLGISGGKLPRRLFSLLGLYHDPNEDPSQVFFPNTSANAAYKLFSCIECTPVENKTEPFCKQIAEYLFILSIYNDSIYKRRNAYPYSEELMDVLRAYVELEYETLYGNYSFVNMARLQLQESEEVEERVKKRVVERLNHILPCCYDYCDDFHHGMRPVNVTLSRDMHVFQVLKSVKLKYQNKGFIKTAMKEIIDNNAEMCEILRRKLKNRELNSITSLWRDTDIAFLTDRELHPCLTETIPENYYDCLKFYNIDMPIDFGINLDDDLTDGSGTEEMTFDDEMLDIEDLDSQGTVLRARRFLQPPPRISDKYMGSKIKVEKLDDDNEDSGSNAQDESTSMSANASPTNGATEIDTRNASIGTSSMEITSTTKETSQKNSRNRRTKRSNQEERIVGSVILYDDDDIVCVSDDDDNVEYINEVNSDTDAIIEKETDGQELNLGSLAVLADKAVEKAKVQIDTLAHGLGIVEENLTKTVDSNKQSTTIRLEDNSNIKSANCTEKLDDFKKSETVVDLFEEKDAAPSKNESTPDIQLSEPMEVDLEPIIEAEPITESPLTTEINIDESNVEYKSQVTAVSVDQTNADFVPQITVDVASNEIPKNPEDVLILDIAGMATNDPKNESESIILEETSTSTEGCMKSTGEKNTPEKEKCDEIQVPLVSVRTEANTSPIQDVNDVSKTDSNYRDGDHIVTSELNSVQFPAKEPPTVEKNVTNETISEAVVPPISSETKLTTELRHGTDLQRDMPIIDFNPETVITKNVDSVEPPCIVTVLGNILKSPKVIAPSEACTNEPMLTAPSTECIVSKKELVIAGSNSVNSDSTKIQQKLRPKFQQDTVISNKRDLPISSDQISLKMKQNFVHVEDIKSLTKSPRSDSTVKPEAVPVISKNNAKMHRAKVENQLPETIPDVETGSNLPRLSKELKLAGESHANISNARNISVEDKTMKSSPPSTKEVPHEASDSRNNDELLYTKRKSENIRDQSILPHSLKDESAISIKASSTPVQEVRVDKSCQSGYKGKTDYTKKNLRTKAARKQGIDPNTSSGISRNEMAPIDAVHSEQTSRDPLVCGILPEKISDSKDYEAETILRNAGLNVTNISNDFSCELQDTEQETILRNAVLTVNNSSQHISNDFPCELTDILDMEIQTEQDPSAKETGEVNEISNQTNMETDSTQAENPAYPQNEIQHDQEERIEHKIGNQILSIDGAMHKSILCCLGFQKDGITWHSNVCSKGFCNRTLQGQAEEKEDVDTLLLSGSVRSREVLDDIRSLNTEQLFEFTPEPTDVATAANDCRSVIIQNKNIRVRVMDKADINNMVINPMNSTIPNQTNPEHHTNSGKPDPLIEINENTVEELLQISNHTQNRDDMDQNIEIIEAVVTNANVVKTLEIFEEELLQRRFQDLNPREVKEPTTKVVVEHIGATTTNMFDIVKSRDKSTNGSFAHFFALDEPEQRRRQRKQGNKKRGGSTPASSKALPQITANKSSNSSPSQNVLTKSSSTNTEEEKTKLYKANVNTDPKRVYNEGTTNSTFDHLLKTYRNNTINLKDNNSGSSCTLKPSSSTVTNSLPIARNEVKRTITTPKPSESEETIKLLKHSSASSSPITRAADSIPSTYSPTSRTEAKKNTVSRSPSQGTTHGATAPTSITTLNVKSTVPVTDSVPALTKTNRRGIGSLETASSSQGTANTQKGNVRKVGGNINTVTERLQQQVNRNQQQAYRNIDMISSPACDLDYEQQNKQDRSRRLAQTTPQRRPPLQHGHPTSSGVPLVQQYMTYPTKQAQFVNIGLQAGLHNPEFRPWEPQAQLAHPTSAHADASTTAQPPPAHNYDVNRPGQLPARKLGHSPPNMNTPPPPPQNHPGYSSVNNDTDSTKNPPRKPTKANRDIFHNMLPNFFPKADRSLPGFWS